MVGVFFVLFCAKSSKLSMCCLLADRKKGLKCDLTILQKSSHFCLPLSPKEMLPEAGEIH